MALSRILGCVALLGLLAMALAATPATAAPAIDGEFEVPGLDANNKLTQGPDGNIWVTLNDGTYEVAKLTPAGGVTPYDLGVSGPSGIAAGPDGNLWVTYGGGVVKFAPGDPEGEKEATAIAAIAGNHSIVAAPDGNLWVAADGNLVMVPPADPGDAKDFPVLGLNPRDIDVAGPLLVVADFGGKKILTATTDPVAPTIVDYPIAGGPQGVAGSPNGQIAFTQPNEEPKEVGVFTPPGAPLTTQFPGADPFGIALGPDGAYWSAESNGDRLIRITADNQTESLPGFSAGSFPRQIAAGPGNTLWVTLQVASKVARVSGVEAPPLAVPIAAVEPRTRIVKGPKRKVKISGRRALIRFRFRSPNRGAKFECALARIGKRRGKAPKPRFKACKAPKIYALRPGKYRFWVRAVLDGVPDRTPAKRTFFVIRKKR